MTESDDGSSLRALHRLVEHYTPDGTLGRTLMGTTALLCSPLLFFGGWSAAFGSGFLPVALVSVVAALLGTVAFPFGLLVLWPVYLSVIGNVESPSTYPEGAVRRRTGRESATDVLKRRYADGELARDEFERRLDDVMATDEERSGSTETRDRRSKRSGDETDGDVERSRNR